MTARQIWDISPPVDPSSPVFEGDVRYRQRWTFEIQPGACPVNVSEITLSPHTGAHADAPLHYSAAGASVGALALEPYLGPCRVVHALNCGALIEPVHLQPHLSHLPPRVLVRTAARASQAWTPPFAAYAPATVALLASLGVQLIGIDTPSIDPADSATLDSHQLILKHNMRVLENLVLDDVAEGDYELIALPLKLVSADASPVRAILRRI
jgi:arylformamidase